MTRHALLLLFILAAVQLIACGDDPGTETALVSFGVSDAAVGELDAVVLTIDRITLNRSGKDIVIDSFPNEDPEGPDTDTIVVDLLDIQGADYKVIVDAIELEVGSYQNLRLSYLDDNIDDSYVDETGGGRKPIKGPSNELKLGGFEVTSGGPHVFVLEFALTKALTYNPIPDRYIVKPRGVRIVSVDEAALVSGVVDPSLFDGVPSCAEKANPNLGNVVYLSPGHMLDLDLLGDMFDPAIDMGVADDVIEPYASENVAEDGSYLIAFLPPGDYTLAFSCDAEADDPDYDDGIMIPTPENQWVEINLMPGDDLGCDFPAAIEGAECG